MKFKLLSVAVCPWFSQFAFDNFSATNICQINDFIAFYLNPDERKQFDLVLLAWSVISVSHIKKKKKKWGALEAIMKVTTEIQSTHLFYFKEHILLSLVPGHLLLKKKKL